MAAIDNSFGMGGGNAGPGSLFPLVDASNYFQSLMTGGNVPTGFNPLGSGANGFNIFPPPAPPPASNLVPGGSGGTWQAGPPPNQVQQPPPQGAPPAPQGFQAATFQPQTYNSPGGNWLAQLMGGSQQHLQQLATPGSGYFSDLTANTRLGPSGPDADYLRQIVQNQGNPFNVSPVWDAMIAAQQRNVDRQSADLNEQFNTMGGRFSSSFGNAMGAFQDQTTKDQNSLLAQLSLAAHESSQGRALSGAQQLSGQDLAGRTSEMNAGLQQALQQMGLRAGAASQIAGQGFNAANLLSSQDFQNFINQGNQSFTAAMLGSQQAAGAAGQLAATGNTAGQGLWQAGVGAGTQLAGNEVGAANTVFGGQQQYSQQAISSQLQAAGLDAQTANAMAGQIAGQQGLGLQAGGQQQAILQQQIDRIYQEWMRTQPAYNPMFPYLFQGGTAQSPYYWPQQQPSQTGSIIGGAGQIAANLLPIILKLLGGG